MRTSVLEIWQAVLRRDAACLDLYENEPERGAAVAGRPLSSVSLREYRVDTTARVERDARREHCIELFRLPDDAAKCVMRGRQETADLARQGSVPPKRTYSTAEGYCGSTLLGQASKAEKEMWGGALRSVLEPTMAAEDPESL